VEIAGLYEIGRAAWPAIEVPRDVFEAYAAEREPSPTQAAAVYLACACSRGDAAAVGALEDAYFDTVRAAVGRVARDAAIADEAIQLLRTKLFVAGDDGKPPGIAGYAGRGDLRGWLRVAATRTAISLLRARRGVDEDGEIDRIAARGADPELSAMRRRYAAEANDALRTAFAALAPRDRNLLRHHFVDGLGIDALGRRYGVHRATAARWLEKARETLERRTRKLLIERLSVGAETAESIVRMLRSDLHITLSTS
jgi:RNA polymerase sigma-70 factor (ECF subfamily)